MVHIRAGRVIVVATGSAEIQPVCPGNELHGLLTAGPPNASTLPAIGLGTAVAIGAAPDGVPCTSCAGRLVRFEGDGTRRIRPSSPPTRRPASRRRPALRHGHRRSRPCPARRRWRGWPVPTPVSVTVVGSAAAPAPTAADPPGGRCRLPLHGRHGRRPRGGVGPGVSPSSNCSSAPRSRASGRARAAPACRTCGRWIAARTGTVPAPFTARPATRQLTIGGGRGRTSPSTARRDGAPRRAPRPGRADGSVRRVVAAVALRRRGRRVLGGPRGRLARRRQHARQARRGRAGRRRGARAAVSVPRRRHRARPVAVRAAAQRARARDRRRDDPARVGRPVLLTFTSGGAANAEMWVRDWIETWGLERPRPRPDDVAGRDQRHRPARRRRCWGASGSPTRRGYLGHAARRRRRRPVPRDAPRLHRRGVVRAAPPGRSVGRAVAGPDDAGATSASGRTDSRRCSALRLREGPRHRRAWTPSSTRRRAGSGWTGRVRMDKPFFIGRAGARTDRRLPDQRRCVGLHDGRSWRRRRVRRSSWTARSSGHVTSSWYSPPLGRAVMLGWLRPHAVPGAGRASTAARPCRAGRRSTTRRAARARA